MVFPRLFILVLLIGFMASATQTLADVGTRHVLLVERASLQQKLAALSLDSSSEAAVQRHKLTVALVALDGNIITSYNQTLARISQQQQRKSSKEKMLVFISLTCCIITFGSVSAFYYLNKRLNSENGTGIILVYRQLFQDFIQAAKPESVTMPTLTRVNPIVVVGVSFMAISIMVYLLSNLH